MSEKRDIIKVTLEPELSACRKQVAYWESEIERLDRLRESAVKSLATEREQVDRMRMVLDKVEAGEL